MPHSMPHPEAEQWLHRRTYGSFAPGAAGLEKIKRGQKISVCLPALNEAETIGEICASITSDLMREIPLVDELVVIDSESTDATTAVAAAAGAVVHRVTDILPDIQPAGAGKGDALWRSLAVVGGDIVVWVDADIQNFGPRFVVDLVAPLLENDHLVLAKGFYERPLEHADRPDPRGGARVTELLVRPLLNLLYPPLTGVIQPLSGEYAARRTALTKLPFFTGYGVDIGLLIDVVERYGLDVVAQVDLGRKVHRNQDLFALGRMGHQVLQAILMRLGDLGKIKLTDESIPALVQFLPTEDGYEIATADLDVIERPPIATVSRA